MSKPAIEEILAPRPKIRPRRAAEGLKPGAGGAAASGHER